MKPSIVLLTAAALLCCATQARSAPARETARSGAKAQPQARLDAGPRCASTAAPPLRLSLQLGKSTLVRLPEGAVNRSVGNPQVVQAMLVAPDTMYVVGVDIGATNMIVQGRSGACTVVDIAVGLDASGLQSALALALPEEREIQVSSAADSVVLMGTVQDGAAVVRAGELATAFVRKPVQSLLHKDAEDAANRAAPASAAKPEARVINLLNVRAPQQVMIEVKIAEVSKTLLERLEGNASFSFSSGSWAATLAANFLSGKTNGFLDLQKRNDTDRITAGAQKQDSLVRMLAEPTIMALSGQEGSFLAGGSILIPVAQQNDRITLEEKDFGVGLRFLPTVMAGGRINLKVSPEVSEVSREGLGISAVGVTGNAILPLITRRRASTTLQLMDGQSFVIGGLLKNNLINNFNGIPALGEVPILGALFRSVDYQQDKTELIFVVTARLVKPVSGAVPLPTDAVAVPSRAAVLLGGKVGRPEASAAPTSSGTTTSSPSGFELK
ncbi:MAG TPA: type II and III secretion system protein family protein [Telluria sp.]